MVSEIVRELVNFNLVRILWPKSVYKPRIIRFS